MKKALTNKTLEALKPTGKRYAVHDTHCPGLVVRVNANGTKTFAAIYRYGLKQRRLTLGPYPVISLAEARDKARAAFREVLEGVDPQAVRRRKNMNLREGVDAFIEQYAKPRNRAWRESERVLKRELVTRFGERDLSMMTRADILEAADAAITRGAHYQANRIVSYSRKMFNWFLERGMIETSPLLGIRAPMREQSRDRVLARDEIAQLIGACHAEPFPFGPYTLLLLVTAQRRSEVANMRWSEIDWERSVWEIPASRSKNGKPHEVPLSPLALATLKGVPRFEGSDLVFTTTGYSPISGITKMVLRIQAASETANWRLHDLRRTAASEMARMGVSPHVVEKVLNHVSGTLGGVAGVYNRYGYDPEKRDALERWGIFLEQLGE
jgi:integrase